MSFAESEGYHSFSSYIDAEIEGRTEKNLVMVVPMDLSGSYGLGAALLLLEHYSATVPELNLRVIFLGAEKGDGDLYPLGSRNFLETFYPENPTAFIYLDFDELPGTIKLETGANGYTTPYWLFRSTAAALEEGRIPYYHSFIESILYRLSAVETDSAAAAYLAEGYPAIVLSDFNETGGGSPSENTMIQDGEILDFFDALIRSCSEGFSAERDIHYISQISERQYLIIYTVLIMLLMIYPIFRRKHFGWYMKSLGRNFWIIPALFGLVFALLAGSSLLISAFLSLKKFPGLWQHSPLPFLFFKLSVTIFAYAVIARPLSRLPFSKRGSFYSISAIFFLVLMLFVLTWIDLSLSIFALWPLCFIFLFTITKKAGLKLVLLLLSAAWIIYGLVEIFLLKSLRTIELIILSPVWGNLLLALILLPLILASIRLDLLFHPFRRLTKFTPLIFGVISAGLFILLLNISPYDELNPQPVTITEVFRDGQLTEKTLHSPASLPESFPQAAELLPPIDEAQPETIEIDIDSTSFLNRKIVKTEVQLPPSPEKVSVTIKPEQSITLFESSYPASWFPSTGRLEVYIGKNPPVPLEFSLTLNRDAVLDYEVRADYPPADSRAEIEGRFYLISCRKTLIKDFTDAAR